MSLYDWNHDGKKDLTDDLIEYQIYQNSIGSDRNYHAPSSNRNGMSTFGAVICTILSFVGAGLFFSLLGIDTENVPVILIIIVVAVIAGILGVIGDDRGW